MSGGLVRRLFEGPIDVVGDIHGEIDALRALLENLGYGQQGRHPEKRRLVFVGDLCDRGPDSPAVINLVRDLIDRGLAQCVLGNHELNLLRDERKHGNHWYFAGSHALHEETFGRSQRVDSEEAASIARFFATLPVALERQDLRVVHAAWSVPDIAACRTYPGSALDAYFEFDHSALDSEKGKRLKANYRAQRDAYGPAIHREDQVPEMQRAIAAYDEYYQMSNPIRVLTSGVESASGEAFFAEGKWRFVNRVRWWNDYTDDVPVVFGHYWRWWHRKSHTAFSKGQPNLFEQDLPCGWHRNALGREVAFCVDYSAGARFKERKRAASGPYQGRLAALRWPERQVVFDEVNPVDAG